MNKSIETDEHKIITSLSHQEIKSKKSENIFKRFFSAIKAPFREAQPPSLKGKIQEFHNHSNTIIEQLCSVKNLLEKQIEGEVFEHVKNAIDPMIRDIRKLQERTQKLRLKTENEIFASPKYEMCKHKAKLWIDLHSQSEYSDVNNSDVIETLCNHLFKESEENIKKDLHIIKNYKENALAHLKISKQERKNLETSIHEELRHHTEELKKLKNKPQNMALEELEKWKSQTHEKRSLHFSKALKVIDEAVLIS